VCEFKPIASGSFRKGCRLPVYMGLSLVDGCPNCGSKNIDVFDENPHCWYCGGELVFAPSNQHYSRTELVCTKCGVVEPFNHYIIHCKDCQNEFRVRVIGDSAIENFDAIGFNQIKHAYPFYHRKEEKLSVCPNCGCVVEAKSNEHTCPYCGFLILKRDRNGKSFKRKTCNSQLSFQMETEKLLPVDLNFLNSNGGF